MGLLGGNFNAGEALLGFFADPQAMAARKKRQQEEAKTAATAAQMEQIRQSLAREGLPEHVVNGMMANPEKVADYFLSKFQTRAGGADGISVTDRMPDGSFKTHVTPGYHNGDFMGATDGTRAPERLYQGEKVMPVTKGGYLGVIGGPQNAAPREAPIGAPPVSSGAPPIGTVDEGLVYKGGDHRDPKNWVPAPRGGAGRSGPPTFPR